MTSFASYLEILHATERLPPRELARWQLPQVERMVRHAARQGSFWAARLVPVLRSDRFVPEAWQAVPVLTRAEAQAAGDALRAATVPPESGRVSSGVTSGSTGTPLRYGWSQIASTATRMQLERFWDWHGIDPAGRFAEIRVGSGRTRPRRRQERPWSFRSEAGCFAWLDVSVPIGEQLDWLHAFAPRYLMTYPTHGAALAQAATSRPVALDAVVTVGEVLRPEARQTMAEGFARDGKPAQVLDTYGCQEVGKLALVCPEGRYHVCVENVVLEILDDDGRVVGPGREGWVTITGLYNFATPFIRYRLGDRAIAGSEPCSCGRTLPVIDTILGRARNMLILPDGNLRWPSNKLALGFARFVPFRQFQVVQTTPEHLVLRYVPDDTAPSPDLAGLAAHIREALHPGMSIALEPVATIARAPGGKFEDFVSLVA